MGDKILKVLRRVVGGREDVGNRNDEVDQPNGNKEVGLLEATSVVMVTIEHVHGEDFFVNIDGPVCSDTSLLIFEGFDFQITYAISRTAADHFDDQVGTAWVTACVFAPVAEEDQVGFTKLMLSLLSG